MSCVWIEGFESHVHANQLARKYASASGGMTSASGRVFGIAGGITASVLVTPSVGGTNNTFVLGFGCRLESHLASLNSGNQGLYIETGVNEQCHLELESTSGSGLRWLLKREGTTVATSSYFDFGVWHYFELKLTVRDGTDGAYELRHNGVADISGSSVNLAANATDGWDIFAIRYSTNTGTTLRYDDMYVLNGAGSKNNDFLGPQIVEGILPNGVGTSGNVWGNSSSGDNYTFVDDSASAVPDESGVGGYVSSDTNGQKDTYQFQDLTQITGAINAVQIGTQLAMASAGTRTVKTKYRDPDTTEVDGTSHVVDSTTYDEFTEVYDDNPNSAAAWDVADIDDGEFGIEVVS